VYSRSPPSLLAYPRAEAEPDTENCPATQLAQELWPVAEYFPGPQLVHCVPDAKNMPAAQAEHEVAAAPEDWPPAQALHGAPAVANWPATQLKHEEDPSTEDWPATHVVHEVAPYDSTGIVRDAERPRRV